MNHNHDDSGNEMSSTADQYRTDETDHNSGVFGQVGTGKTQRLAHRVVDTDSTEFIDPKGGEKNGE
jgi:hypothetical protein